MEVIVQQRECTLMPQNSTLKFLANYIYIYIDLRGCFCIYVCVRILFALAFTVRELHYTHTPYVTNLNGMKQPYRIRNSEFCGSGI